VSAAEESQKAGPHRRGRVLEAVRELLVAGRLEETLAVVEKLVARNAELERQLQGARTKGLKNEGISAAQLRLLLDGVPANGDGDRAAADKRLRRSSCIDEKGDEDGGEKPRRSRRRRAVPANLRRVENPITVPAQERPCPKCGVERECIGHEVSEVIDLIPAEVVVRRDVREKLACRPCNGELVRAPLGNKAVAGGRMGTTFVAQVLADKYDDGLPLTRQLPRYERLGLELAVSTLADQVAWATDALKPLWRAVIEQVLSSTVMHLDATSLPVLDRQAAGGIRLGSIWGYVGANVTDGGTEHTALCLYTSTGKAWAQRRGELGPADMLMRRVGFTVADAAGIFDASFRRNQLIECGCNTHARRYFRKAMDAGDGRAALPLAAFKRLFAIERKLRAATIDERRRGRQQLSRPVYDDLVGWAMAYRPHEPPTSALGKAIGYLLNHQEPLRRFLDEGVVPIDNSVVERLHVRTALTRKNFLFAGSDAGGERAAIAFTLMGCCRLAKVDPVTYLCDVLPRLTTRSIRLCDVPALLPAAWKRARAADGRA